MDKRVIPYIPAMSKRYVLGLIHVAHECLQTQIVTIIGKNHNMIFIALNAGTTIVVDRVMKDSPLLGREVLVVVDEPT